jgi:hypothetical protein
MMKFLVCQCRGFGTVTAGDGVSGLSIGFQVGPGREALVSPLSYDVASSSMILLTFMFSSGHHRL